MRTTEPAMERALARFEPSRVILEVGTPSPWVSRLLTRLGHEGIVANPRRVRLIAQNDSKCDDFDAELLARLGRIDPNLLAPIVHRGEQAVRSRFTAAFGARCGSCTSSAVGLRMRSSCSASIR